MLFCLCEERQNDKSTVFIATIDFQKLWELRFTVEDLDRDPGGFFELDQFATFSVIEVGGNTFVDSNLDLANTLLLACEHEIRVTSIDMLSAVFTKARPLQQGQSS